MHRMICEVRRRPRWAALLLFIGLGACQEATSGPVASHELLEQGADNVVFGMTSISSTNVPSFWKIFWYSCPTQTIHGNVQAIN